MKSKVTFCLLCFFISSIDGQQISQDVERFGRRIQLDGFLLEWDSKNSHIWKNRPISWYWDAMNTADGLAGYFKSDSAVKCSSWVFTLTPQGDVDPIVMKTEKDSQSVDLYRFDQNSLDSSGVVICEWLIPWDRLGVDSSGHYTFIAAGVSECTDSLTPILISGSNQKVQGIFSFSFIFRTILIASLLVVYIILSIRIRNRNRQKESLHQ